MGKGAGAGDEACARRPARATLCGMTANALPESWRAALEPGCPRRDFRTDARKHKGAYYPRGFGGSGVPDARFDGGYGERR